MARARQIRRPPIGGEGGTNAGGAGAGKGIDIYGGAAIDPTENVLALVEALNETLKLLRAADTLRQDDLRAAESKRQDDLQTLRASYELRMDSQRTDYEKRIAEILSAQIDKSAALLSNSVDKLTVGTNERISAVEKNQYVSGGKSSVTDPHMAEEVAKLAALVQGLTATKDTQGGMGQMVGWIAAGFMSLVSLGVAVLALRGH